jgi:L-amino acid N-acyltransferase YncA
MATRPATRCKAAIISISPFHAQYSPSTDSDIPAITAIYAHHVLHGTGTFEIDPPTEADMATRRADVLARGLPWLVAEKEGQVWALPMPTGSSHARPTASRPRTRFMWPTAHAAWAWAASCWQLALQAEAAGVRKLLAVIGDSANAGSIGLHRALGFTDVAHPAVDGLEVRRLARHRADGKTTPGRVWSADDSVWSLPPTFHLGAAPNTLPIAAPRGGRFSSWGGPMKNKTVAAWLAFVGGPLGLHRFYLHGLSDMLGWLLPIPTALGLYGIQRVQRWGRTITTAGC